MDIKRSALVAHPAAFMFDIVDAPELYPQFLPWCSGAVLRSRDEAHTSADILVDFKGLRFRFATHNPKSRPDFMRIDLVEGPFAQFDGEWRFSALGADACRIDFSLAYSFRSAIVTGLTGRVFEIIANTLVDAFVARADQLSAAKPG
jgi:ribosome-associated toxin RatA of RatAB toxin-antitoxin module